MLPTEDSAVLACFNQFYHRTVIMVMLYTEESTVLACFNQFYHRPAIMVIMIIIVDICYAPVSA